MPRTHIARITGATAASIVGQAPTALIPPAIAVIAGASAATDRFFLAFAVISLVTTTMLAAAQHVSVPFFVDAHHSGRSILPELATVIAGFSVALLLAAGALLGVARPDYSAWLLSEAQRDYWSLAPYGLCAALSGLAVGALNAARDFAWPALTPAVRSAAVLLVLLAVGGGLGPTGIALGYALGEGCRLLLPGTRLRRRTPDPVRFGSPGPTGREFARRAIPQMAGSAIVAAVPLIDRITASTLTPGSVSILDYADRLWQVPIGVVTSGFIVVSLAEWSHHVSASRSRAALGAAMRRSAAALFGLAVPASLTVVVFRRPIVQVLFGHGAFPLEEIDRLADTLGTLAACTPVYVAGLAYTRGFLALKQTSWLLAGSLVMVSVKIALNVALAPVWGLVGIATATGLAYAGVAVVLAAGFHGWVLRRDPPGSAAS